MLNQLADSGRNITYSTTKIDNVIGPTTALQIANEDILFSVAQNWPFKCGYLIL